jgi:hypothetical protein
MGEASACTGISLLEDGAYSPAGLPGQSYAAEGPHFVRGSSCFYTEFNFLGEDLLGRQGNHLAVAVVDFGIPQHGKLKRSAGSGAGNLVHIAVILN